ncbi:MAG TPA: hypothetical protein VH518_25280 [Tepidisphaeraceae bacterium]|jgi:hypothetical protein
MTQALPTSPPDWSLVKCDILCPLCDYNLRGLVEPRCPECGHQFKWDEILSQGDRTHPFLFEHQPHRNVWSFFRTLRESMMPRRFWRSVLPIHRIIPRRLIVYWLLLLSLGFLAALPAIPQAMRQESANLRASRQWMVAWLTRSPSDPQAAAFLKTYGSPAAAANASYPALGTFALFGRALTQNWSMQQMLIPPLAAAVSWPWLTLASLLIFRASLAQARIKTGHVLRCVIYCEDLLLLLLPGFMMALSVAYVPGWWMGVAVRWVGLGMSLAALLLTYRLAMAYRLYLRFPHAIATVIASQIIVGLALFKAYLMWLGF